MIKRFNKIINKNNLMIMSALFISLVGMISYNAIENPANAIAGIECQATVKSGKTPAFNSRFTDDANFENLNYGSVGTDINELTSGNLTAGSTVHRECLAVEHAYLVVSPILTEISKLLPFAIVVILPLTVGMVLLRYVFRRTRSKKIGL